MWEAGRDKDVRGSVAKSTKFERVTPDAPTNTDESTSISRILVNTEVKGESSSLHYPLQRLLHGGLCRDAGGDAVKIELLEGW
eukprot:scaffold123736_cov60-Phaeocystis_antarctica.AAC.3